MKIKPLLSYFIFSLGVNTYAAELSSITDVKNDYLQKINKEETDRRKPLVIEKVKHQEKDVNGDGKPDLLVFDYYHCGSADGCRSDIYLCSIGDTPCEQSRYCFAGRLQEGEITKKGKLLKCN